MSPEAKKFFGLTRETLIEGLGASEDNLQRLQLEVQKALESRDFERAQHLVDELSQLNSLRESLFSAEDTLTPILEEFGLQEKDIHFTPTTREEPAPQPAVETKVGRRKPEKYIENATLTIAQALVAKLPSGEFVYNSPEEIARLILQKDKRADQRAIQDASFYVYASAKNLAERFLDFAEYARANKVKTLIHKALSRVKNEAWVPFYEEVGDNFGNLSPQEFVENIILRLFPKKKAREEIQRERKRKEKMRQKLIPSDLSALDELSLCNKFLWPQTMERIRIEILGGQDPEAVARRHGWQCDKAAPQAFLDCREKMAERRGYRIPTEDEAAHSSWVIQQTVRRLAQNRKGWHTINKDYLAFRFLFSLMAEVSPDPKSVDRLLDILFQRKEYQIDSRNSFFLVPGMGEENR